MKLLTRVLTCISFLLFAYACFPEEITSNLIADGGVEEWKEVSPGNSFYDWLTVNKHWEFSMTGKGDILIPVIHSQLQGGQGIFKREQEDIFSGKYSLRLQGEFYLRQATPEAYNTRSGDIYIVRYRVKGSGDTVMNLTVYGDGDSQIVKKRGKPSADSWTLIEERIIVAGSAPTTIYPRLWTSGDMLIDDIFIGRLLREDEMADNLSVPREYDERVAFASAVSQGPVIDGRLDEECWKTAIPFSGFRLYEDNTQIAPYQTYFRVLHDEKAVYFGIEILLPDAQQVLEELKENPLKDSKGILKDKDGDVYTARHSVEIFLQPPTSSRYIQCVVSLDGYRYDGAGTEGVWNGEWTYGTGLGNDRWFLEVMIPAGDLGLKKIEAVEGWRLNITSNKEVTYSTWAATGLYFHNPFAFGMLITEDFNSWRAAKTEEWADVIKEINAESGKLGLVFNDRIEAAENFTGALPQVTVQEKLTWETVTRIYMLMNFVDTAYRGMEAETRYARFFTSDKKMFRPGGVK